MKFLDFCGHGNSLSFKLSKQALPLKLVWNFSLTKSQTAYHEWHPVYVTNDKPLMVTRSNKFKLTSIWLKFIDWPHWKYPCGETVDAGQITFILPITHPRKELYSSCSSPETLATAAVLLQSFTANTTQCAALKIWLAIPEIFHLPLIFS